MSTPGTNGSSLGEGPASPSTALVTSDATLVTRARKLSVAQAAEVAQVSRSTVLRAISKGILPAKRRGKSFTVMRDVIIKLAPQLRERAPASAGREQHEGERDSRVVELLEEGKTVAQIVITERVPLETVLRLRETWLRGHQADRQGLAFVCSCGSPSNPHTARCDRCAPRTRTLSDAQLAVLAGQPAAPPGTSSCSGCGRAYPTPVLDRLCLACRDRIVVHVQGGCVRVLLRMSDGRVLPLRTLTADESRQLGASLVPPPVGVPVPTTPPGEHDSPTEGLPGRAGPMLGLIEAMTVQARAQLDEDDRRIAEARARLKEEA